MVGQREDSGRIGFPLPQHDHVQPDAIADAALGVHDGVVHLFRRQIDEPRRQLDQQRLELQPLEALRRIEPFFGLGPIHGLVAIHRIPP